MLINVFSQVINIKVFADLSSSESPLSGLKVALPLHGGKRKRAHTWISSSLYKGTNPIMRVSPSGPHLNSITSQQFYVQINIRFGARASMYDFGRGKNIHSITVCVCVLLMRESYMGLGCEELYKPGSYILVLYFNVRFCPNFWAICLSGRFSKYRGNSAILRLLLSKFSSKFSFS